MYVAQEMGIEEDDRRIMRGKALSFLSLSLTIRFTFAEKDNPEDGW